AIGILSNILLIYLVSRFSKKNMGTYKYLLIIFASYDLYLTVIHAIIEPPISSRYRKRSSFSLYRILSQWLTMLYVASFTVPFALTNVNFLHRYWAVKKPTNLSLFTSPRFVLLLSMYPIGQGVGWAVLSCQVPIDDSHFVEDYYFSKFNTTITGWRVLHHWKGDHLNLPQFLILISAMIVMSFNFSIAIFLASQTIAEIRKAKTFSFNFKSLQIKILRALFAQTSVPVLFVYIPFGCAILFPFFKIDDKLQLANSCMTFTSFFPAWDAIVVIILIKDYRDCLLSLFCYPTNSS
ncbi:hypothetical protein PMAYCL1PPCAC_01722, partial [Pristionchus mayeri]